MSQINIQILENYNNIDVIKQLYNNIYCYELDIQGNKYKKDEYDESSVHFFAKIENNTIGYLRVIKPSQFGLPAIELAKPNIEIDYNSCVEFSRLMIEKEFRSNPNICLRILEESFKYVLYKGYSVILIDVFFNCEHETYNFFKKLGFKECSEPYLDTRFKKSYCILLYMDLTRKDLLENINTKIKNRTVEKYIIGNLEKFHSTKI